MKIQRTRNATRNVAVGAALRLYQMIGPFVLRTVMIYILGMQYVGLNSLFTSILQVLNLAELGVGSAMVYSMYRPIAEDDEKKICMLMKLYRIYYRVIGGAICGLGLAIIPVLPKLISGDVPADINIYILYLLNLAATVLSYWLFAYKNSLLTAHQRNDIIDLITILTTTLQYVFQIVTLVLFGNYYLYIVIALFSQVLLNIITALVANKMYPNYHPSGKIDKDIMKDINQKIRDLFTSKLGEVIVNSADTIVISAFLGLTILAMYNNYYYILTAVMGFVTLLFKSSTAGIGNSLVVESLEKNYNDLNKFTFLVSWIGFFCGCCLLCLYQPFMKLWVGESYMLEFGCVICFSGYFYIRVINQVLIVYKDAAGMWHEDRFRPLCTALTNLFLNLALVQFMGIYGVLLSTVLSTLLVGMPWVIKNIFTVVLKRDFRDYIKKLLLYVSATIVGWAITYFVCSFIKGNLIVVLVIRLLICLVFSNVFYIVIFHNMSEFKETVKLIDNIIGKKISVVHSVLIQLYE
mgnify:CR=1 FL=1